ncbi:phosphoenolpyruvate--protein phosphotransferase [Couchioplanes caeruleus]|uniref:phosphoenolpyruvate--protein phosphotransferase n=1 Tax=Couchioplanes caeruleus TaxID=56438 RepID=UPI00201C7D6C|nr:phosphoenolpyruvate--protein phosphotransferase [Couchioplanes caeruleus]UQU63752.1 phosphoenolpyruvate--protein phosphotransferase [Couchioplanes caeruleus]
MVVSHSRALARAAVALAAEMTQGQPVPIEIAAGLDETTTGTDAVAITTAIQAADRGDGVVVLMDLGSAVLSAELALDLLDDAARDRVVLCPAPLVEGLVAAVVTAAGGAGRKEVAGEAVGALAGKLAHLGGQQAPPPEGTGTDSDAEFVVRIPHGLHARPAARLVTQARGFDARVELRNGTTGSGWVPASSLSRVATLGVLPGHRVDVRASGPQAREAVDGILALAAADFGENEGEGDRSVPEPPARAEVGAGVPASPGIAVGPVRHAASAVPEIPGEPSRGAEQEHGRLEAATATVRDELRRLRAATAREVGEGHADIFDAHLLLLDDADLLDDVRARIDDGTPAPRAWADATERVAAEFDVLEDPYLRGRAFDVRDVGLQVLRTLLGAGAAAMPEAGVLVASELSPAEAAVLDPERAAGVLLAYGSPTSHGAILARTRGIPAVVGLGPAILEVPDGTPVALDGGTGEVVVAPADAVLTGFRERAAEQASRRDRAAARATAPAATRDGEALTVGANVGSVADARAAAGSGADLAGLVRTEFLFLDRDAAPDADEQEAVYRQIAEALGGRRLTLRTLDVGGDKPLRYLPAAAEANPFLGVRGIRHSLAHPRLLADQLLAFVRVAHDVPVSVMVPMVSTVAEVVDVRRMLDEAVARAGRGTPPGLRVGIMTEVPATALKTAALTPYVDFFSIGTNDLTQYALAAERGNAALAALADGLDPGVLRLIDAVCRGAGGRATVAVCGELASDEAAVPLLAGLGVRQLSVVPRMVPLVKDAIRATDLAAAAPVAARALDAPDAAAVRALIAR